MWTTGCARWTRSSTAGALDAGAVRSHKGTFSAERLYENQKITDLVSKAETEQADYRRAYPINVFFGPKKYLGNFSCSVLAFNAGVLLGFTLLMLGVLHLSLRRQLSTKA